MKALICLICESVVCNSFFVGEIHGLICVYWRFCFGVRGRRNAW